jgi:hypothetical protein
MSGVGGGVGWVLTICRYEDRRTIANKGMVGQFLMTNLFWTRVPLECVNFYVKVPVLKTGEMKFWGDCCLKGIVSWKLAMLLFVPLES